MNLLDQLDSFQPLDFTFGHTPVQVEHFRTQQQRGDPRFEYWQHLVQLRALRAALRESQLDQQDLEAEIAAADHWWPVWNRRARRRRLPRLHHRHDQLLVNRRERESEARLHLDCIERRYRHLTGSTEAEILAGEPHYWAVRLGRQLAASHLARTLGVGEGEIAAVMALPVADQRAALLQMAQLLDGAKPLLP